MGVVIGSFGIVQQSLLTRRVDFRTQTIVTLLATVGSGIIGIGMAWCGFGVWSLLGQSLAMSLFGVLLLWTLSPWRPRGRFCWECIGKLWPFSSRLLASGLLNTLFLNLYSLVIGKVYLPADLGIIRGLPRCRCCRPIPSPR